MDLFDPLQLNGITLPNRVLVPAMVTRLSGEDGMVNEDIIARYPASEAAGKARTRLAAIKR